MNDSTTRRSFVGRCTGVCIAGASMIVLRPARAQAGAHVEESDEQAVALGYKHDTTKVDGAKYPKHQPTQRCSNCSFWQGKADDAWGGCAMFGRKHIANGGWCQAWAKGAG